MVFLFDTIDEDRCVQFIAERTLNLNRLHFETVRIEQVAEVSFFGAGVLACEQAVVQTHFGIERRVALHPVDRCFCLAVTTFRSGLGVRVVGSINGSDISVCIFLTTGCLDDIRCFKTHFATTRAEAEELVICLFEEVATLDE